MDQIIVGFIVALAAAFLIKRFVDIFRGKKSCDCGGGCSCSSDGTCPPDLFMKK